MRKTYRNAGWLAVAGLLAAALVAPAAVSAARSETPINSGNPTCAQLGDWEYEFKIDDVPGSGIVAGTYKDGDSDVTSNWPGQEITITGGGQTFGFTATKAVSAVFVKAGTDNHMLYTYDPAVTSDTGLTHGLGQQGISHVSFCGDAPTVTEPPVTDPPVTDPPVTDPPVTEPPVTEPPSQDIEGETGTPTITLPPSDSLNSTSGPSNGAWTILLVALAGLMASALVLTPAARKTRR